MSRSPVSQIRPRPFGPSSFVLLGGALLFSASCALLGSRPAPLSREVEIRRTSYGVPHILAENLEA
ncbi:hypothetical protein ACFL3Z_02765, partial [Gemmatimonadota bacterium]